jgi:hypothetical protein
VGGIVRGKIHTIGQHPVFVSPVGGHGLLHHVPEVPRSRLQWSYAALRGGTDLS